MVILKKTSVPLIKHKQQAYEDRIMRWAAGMDQ